MKARFVMGALLASVGCGAAQADTLRDAFVRVYADNPTLTGARAGLRATDEDAAIARAQGRPNLGVTGGYSEFVKRSPNSFTAPRRAATATVQATLPLYQGGQVRNAIRAADARVGAGRGQLRSVEANLFAETVAAYMDVIRDAAIVRLNDANVRVLETNAGASRTRFGAGDVTRTDVAQSDARLAFARSQAQQAQAQLEASRETYLRIVGKLPENLEAPPPLPAFPADPDDAVEIAVENSPALETARQQARAADYDIGIARSSRLPRVSAFASGDYRNYFGTLGTAAVQARFAQRETSATAGVQVTLPLYQGGEPSARVRQAQARSSGALENVTLVERGVIADARTAFARLRASEEVIRSSETAIAANEVALRGTKAEQEVGTRNLLDVLNAEQELLNSRVTLVTARRDAYVAGFSLLATIGRAEARYLGLESGPLYDPALNYLRVRGRIGDWSDGPAPRPLAARTVGVTTALPPVAPGAMRDGGAEAAPTAPVTTPVRGTPPSR